MHKVREQGCLAQETKNEIKRRCISNSKKTIFIEKEKCSKSINELNNSG